MMKIKRYNKFLLERIEPSTTDAPAILNDINTVNDLENNIIQFNSKKTELENIYITSTDEKQLLGALKARGYISPTTNKKDMKFINPILGKYAQVCDLRKQVNDLSKQMVEVDDKMKQKEIEIKNNPTLKSTIQQEIKSIMTDKDNKKSRINSIKEEADRQEREVMKYFREMEQELYKGKNNIKQSRDIMSKATPK